VEYNALRTLEFGCGFGHLTNSLYAKGFNSIGLDVSKTALVKARQMYPEPTFIECSVNDFDIWKQFDVDIYLMPEISWYILDALDQLILNLKELRAQRKTPIFLIHILTTYPPGVQKYGADKFTNLDEILKYFDLQYLESGTINTNHENQVTAQSTFFIAKI